MHIREFLYLLHADMFRYVGRKVTFIDFAKQWLIGIGGWYTVWMRLTQYLETKSSPGRLFWALSWFIQRHYTIKYGIQIAGRSVGPGLFISHFGGIIVNSHARIGRNCNISQGVTIGISKRGKNAGCPTIGDEVYIGPYAQIIGRITIGNHVAIGANAVVTKDVPDHSVVAGIPARIISTEGSQGYIHNANWHSVLCCSIPQLPTLSSISQTGDET